MVAVLAAFVLATSAVAVRASSPGLDKVYVATGVNFPDALAGGVLAALEGAPVLRVTKDTIPPDTEAELTRLTPKKIVIFGGAGVVSDAVAAQLAVFATANTADEVTRLAGTNRFATAAEISKLVPEHTTDAETFDGKDSTDFVATGDLLSAVVDGDGTLVSGHGAISAERLGVGRYTVSFNRDLTGCTRVVTPGSPGFGTNGSEVYSTELFGTNEQVFAAMWKPDGSDVRDGPFHLLILC